MTQHSNAIEGKIERHRTQGQSQNSHIKKKKSRDGNYKKKWLVFGLNRE